MSEPMREQILSQPGALRALMARREEIAGVVDRAAAGAHRIWAVGHGDSYFAPLAAAEAFRRWARAAYVPLLAQEFVAYPPLALDAGGLVIAISMSGGVGRSIAAARLARDRGARVVAITNTPGSPLTREADEVLLLQIPESSPFLAGTVTFTASTLALMIIALSLGERSTGAASASLAGALDALDEALAAEGAIRAAAAQYSGSRIWYFLGMNGQVAAAHYGAAKMTEVADVVGIAHETEEFFHEHHWVVRVDDPVVLIAHDAPSQERAAAAAARLRELAIPVWLIGGSPLEGVHHVPLAAVDPWASPLPASVPLQWLALWVARAKGLDPDARAHLRESARYAVSRKYR